MGVATTRETERVMASMGVLHGVPLQFEASHDVEFGGILLAIPALLSLGLLSGTRDHFTMEEGYYPMESIFLLMAFLALARVKSLEELRYQSPGEWGKLLGLDRIPEVKTVREKLGELSENEAGVRKWSSGLAQGWMNQDMGEVGVLYIDGHVRVYHGEQTQLPRRYVARQKLCLRGITDYWVNGMDGQPFFLVSQPIDPGIIQVIENTLLPRLLEEVPNQPDAQALEANPLLHRFVMIFDRAGYSPAFFLRLKELRIAILSYHKFPGDDWDECEFSLYTVRMAMGAEVQVKLAERGTLLSSGLWAREVRYLKESGHQTSIIVTDYISDLTVICVWMLSRWSQENFFKYMREHYGIDRLVEHGTEPIPDTSQIVNPAWRKLDSQVRSDLGKLTRLKAQFGGLNLPVEMEGPVLEQKLIEKSALLESIQAMEEKVKEDKGKRKQTPKHIPIKDLPPEHQFKQLATAKKHLVDTIKLIGYRAETVLTSMVRENIPGFDDARCLVRQMLTSSADIVPDLQNKTLTIKIHGLSSPGNTAHLDRVCKELTETETCYPTTDLRLIFQVLGSPLFPPGQEV